MAVEREVKMAEKDLSEKILLSYDDVFADIVNGLLFKGEERIKPKSLKDKIVHSQYKASDDKLHEEERDVFKVWEDCGIEIALCGLENQSQPYRMMPARVISYDGASYRSQILDNKNTQLLPVITLVLYFGDKHWHQPKYLKKLFGNYPDELKGYVNDYKIHVFEIAWLTDEEIARFKGDFRIVANFFAMKRRTKGLYVPEDPQEIKHVDAVLKLLSVMTGDDSYRNSIAQLKGRRNISMCDVAQNLIMKGKVEGKAEERADNIAQLAKYFMKQDSSLSKKEAETLAKKIIK